MLQGSMDFFVEALLVAQFIDQIETGDDDDIAAGELQLINRAVLFGKAHEIGNGRLGADLEGVAG